MAAVVANSGAGAPSTAFECPVCLDDFASATCLNSVTCGCGLVVCMGCSREYLLQSADEPHCMKCKRAWDRSTQYRFFGGKFINGPYRKHQQMLLLNKEKHLMPGTLQVIADEKEHAAHEKDYKIAAENLRYDFNRSRSSLHTR